MEIKELQNKSTEIIDKIDEKLNVKHNNENTLIHLTEELGEIARQINNKNIRNVEQNIDNIAEEIADVILIINKLASNYNIDVEKAIKEKLEKLKQRHNL